MKGGCWGSWWGGRGSVKGEGGKVGGAKRWVLEVLVRGGWMGVG